jgi:hypothetical protein
MALEGQLSDFNLAEILQLISSQGKSGFLRLEAHRPMVFIFAKGELISTRDRRDASRDPFESFLRAYGFFTESQWKHIDYIRSNSSLDLTEILISENLMEEDELIRVLKSLAQEMTHMGMKLRRGHYHFNATKESPPGVRSRYRLDVQGLLMESARRLDEESQLAEALPSQALTFGPGNKSIPAEALSPTGRHIMKLALAGVPLGRIIRQGKAESFVVRDLIKTWILEGFLEIVQGDLDSGNSADSNSSSRKFSFQHNLRSLPFTLLAVILLAGVGFLRWGSPILPPSDPPQEVLRMSQLDAEVQDALRLHRYHEGKWPASLGELVRNGLLSPETQATVDALGWKYSLNKDKDRFSFGG